MKKVIIFGNSDFAKLIKWYLINDAHLNVVAATVDDEYVSSNYFDGIPLIPFSKVLDSYSNHEYYMVICLGYNAMNMNRKNVFEKCKKHGYSILTYIHSTAIIASNVELGEGNIILEKSIIQPFTKIGKGNIFWSNVNISHDDMIGDFNFFAPSSSVAGFVKIGNNCFFGNNCTIRNGIEISNFTLVGAGTYINKDTLPNHMYKINGSFESIINYNEIRF